jgi:hypothetical protein
MYTPFFQLDLRLSNTPFHYKHGSHARLVAPYCIQLLQGRLSASQNSTDAHEFLISFRPTRASFGPPHADAAVFLSLF